MVARGDLAGGNRRVERCRAIQKSIIRRGREGAVRDYGDAESAWRAGIAASPFPLFLRRRTRAERERRGQRAKTRNSAKSHAERRDERGVKDARRDDKTKSQSSRCE